MTSWEKTYREAQERLDKEADRTHGKLSREFIWNLYAPNYRDPVRTIPRILAQLENAHVISKINQFSYRYLMNGWKDHWVEIDKANEKLLVKPSGEEKAKVECDRMFKAKAVTP